MKKPPATRKLQRANPAFANNSRVLPDEARKEILVNLRGIYKIKKPAGA